MSDDGKLFQQLCEKFEQHVERFEQHELDEIEKFDKLIVAQQKNTDAISTLTESVSTLVEDTSVMVSITKDLQGAARLGSGLQRFMVWLLKWGAIGTGVYTGIEWLIDHFNS